jgi:hypothetical protein
MTLQHFDAKQLNEELLGRTYLMPVEMEVYVKNLIRIVGEQDTRIAELEARVLQLDVWTKINGPTSPNTSRPIIADF